MLLLANVDKGRKAKKLPLAVVYGPMSKVIARGD